MAPRPGTPAGSRAFVLPGPVRSGARTSRRRPGLTNHHHRAGLRRGSRAGRRREATPMVLSEWDPKRGRQGRRWRSLVESVCAPGSLCQVERCKVEESGGSRAIVHGLRRNHPHGPSVDHIVSPLDGGHPTALWNLRPAHFGCNAARGRASRPGRVQQRRPTSRRFPPVDLTGS